MLEYMDAEKTAAVVSKVEPHPDDPALIKTIILEFVDTDQPILDIAADGTFFGARLLKDRPGVVAAEGRTWVAICADDWSYASGGGPCAFADACAGKNTAPGGGNAHVRTRQPGTKKSAKPRKATPGYHPRLAVQKTRQQPGGKPAGKRKARATQTLDLRTTLIALVAAHGVGKVLAAVTALAVRSLAGT